MVASLQSAPNEVTRGNVTAWVQAHVDDGVQPNDAFRLVFDDMERLGQLEDLARLLGPTLVGEIWRSRNNTLRPANVGTEFRHLPQPPAASASTPSRMPSALATPNPPVLPMPTLAAKSLVEGMYKIGSEWVRLGDMNKALCHAAFKQYRASALSDEHNARYFRAIEETLQEGEVVSQRFDDQKLMRIYQLAKP